MTPHTRHRLAYAAGVFAVLGLWLTIVALIPAAVDQRIAQQEATAEPNVAALSEREAADEAKTPSEAPIPSESPKQASEQPSAPKKVIRGARITTYQAVAAQTDATPCVGAMAGVNFCDPPFPIVANNCLPLGTKVAIYANTYTVADRMNSRHGCSVFDILTDGENFTLTADVYVL